MVRTVGVAIVAFGAVAIANHGRVIVCSRRASRSRV